MLMAGLVVLALTGAAGGPTDALQQCQLALRYCAAGGPISATSMAGSRHGSQESMVAQSAAAELADAAKRLARCAERGDFDDDCYREARRVKAAVDDYQSAASEYQRSER